MTAAARRIRVPELRRAFADGKNLMALLRDARAQDANDEVAIQYSYDLQAGSYVAALKDVAFAEQKRAIGHKLAGIFAELGAKEICEAGVGEATTLAEVLSAATSIERAFGFDISLSRLLHAKKHLGSRGATSAQLFLGALGSIPLVDDAIDVVYTFHSVEPNGGRERPVLEELLRVTHRYLVLVEPCYELGSAATKAHIERHRYVRDLRKTLESMQCRIVRYELWGVDANPANEAALIVVDKNSAAKQHGLEADRFAVPGSREPLTRLSDCMHSEDDGVVFPIVSGIPCLLPDNAIVATQMGDFAV